MWIFQTRDVKRDLSPERGPMHPIQGARAFLLSEGWCTPLRANPSKDGDAESRGYRGLSAMLAGPPAFRPRSKSAASFLAPERKRLLTFKHKLSVRLAMLNDVLRVLCARKEVP